MTIANGMGIFFSPQQIFPGAIPMDMQMAATLSLYASFFIDPLPYHNSNNWKGPLFSVDARRHTARRHMLDVRQSGIILDYHAFMQHK